MAERLALWRSRTDALTHLRAKKPEQIASLEDVIRLLDACIDRYEAQASTDDYARACGLAAVKAKHLGIGAYSLILDGLGQEAGALLRPFLEYVELLTYFRAFPNKVADALSDALPKAGERAKAIDGIYKGLREHLNRHASHSSYSSYALAHMLEPRQSTTATRFKKLQSMVPSVLESNMCNLAVHMWLFLSEAAVGLKRLNCTDLPVLAAECDGAKLRLLGAFNLHRDAAGVPNEH